ncbi:proteasome assembly chaperone family protein [Microbacterium sp. MYb64]|uniref:proteasome assembly chaperone family protein n=1 Tax=Microbacterium sp. MYb64 TaxID=1848691 RepID=UPI000CFC4386|nr:PAC2 family protein [Microbacterium sp. MYb64]PRB02482.1 PAC2 family protein [Microbacterium sp. MYb64]
MPISGEIHERVAYPGGVPSGLPLVILLTGFTDAGSAVSGLIDHLAETTDPQPVLVFDNDLLLDYRARRPVLTFDQDHIAEFKPARLELSLAQDALGRPFLLLAGYEPDFAWNAFADVVLDFAAEYDVSTVTWVHSIAMPVPHTRPIGVTASGNRAELTAAHSVWRPRTQVPGTAGHLLEYRFVQAERSVASFVLLVPHYLADTEYPDAVLTAAEKVMAATGLVLLTDALRDKRAEYLERVDEQVRDNEELAQMVRTLEHRYDSYMSGVELEDEAPVGFDERSLPSADELAAELERFLATRQGGDEDKNGRI